MFCKLRAAGGIAPALAIVITDEEITMRAFKKPDAQIHQDVLNELAWDTRVDATDVGVAVHDGVVTLMGTVPSWAKKAAAEDAAHRVAGVLDVANDIIVKIWPSTERSDSDIAAAVRNALEWDVFVPSEHIQSTVANGLVTLTGHVDNAMQRHDAARAVGNLAGVRAIDNLITVDELETSPEAIRSAIQNALERRADREAAKIQIDVEGGRVILHGDVPSWRERDAIIGAATGTRGVHTVVDRLHQVNRITP
jgi:osmotically-inducible protein OsmY